MSLPRIDSYISKLHRQVADEATRIKQKTHSTFKGEVLYDDSRPAFWFSGVETQAYELVGGETAYYLLGQKLPADSGYAAGLYGTVSKIDKPSTVIEGLVFENNKEFDFKV